MTNEPRQITDQERHGIATVIDMFRRPIARLTERHPDVEPVDIALASVLAAIDIMAKQGIPGPAIIEWLRNCVDVFEMNYLAEWKNDQ